jgi:gag-polypeptide of LTR copia-type
MQQFREHLTSMGKSIEEEDYASILIASLLPSYNTLIKTLTQNADTNKTDITLDLIYKRVCNAYDKHLLRQDEDGNGQDKLFAASTHKPKDKKNIECFNCYKKGHIKVDCWAKGSGKEGQGPRRKQGGTPENVAAALDKPEDEL